MQLIDASVILDDAYQLIGWDQTQLETLQKKQARAAFSQALQEIWQRWWWEDVMDCARTQFAPTYTSGVAYSPVGTAVVYNALTDQYYLNMQATTTQSPTDASGNENTAYWARWTATIAIPTLVSTPDGGTTAATDYPYYAFTTTYGLGDKATYNAADYDLGVSFVSNWVSLAANNTNNEPFKQAPYTGLLWGWLFDWTPNFLSAPTPVYGDVFKVARWDPRKGPCKEYHFDRAGNVFGLDTGRPWIWRRRPTPVVTGDDFDATVSYTATGVADLVFDS